MSPETATNLLTYARRIQEIEPGVDLSLAELNTEGLANDVVLIDDLVFRFPKTEEVRRTLRTSAICAGPRLIHGDLGPYHVLVTGSELTGIIDFGTAGLGDPANDLACLLQNYGERFVARVDGVYPNLGPLLRRARFLAQALEFEWVGAGAQEPTTVLVHRSYRDSAGSEFVKLRKRPSCRRHGVGCDDHILCVVAQPGRPPPSRRLHKILEVSPPEAKP